MPVGASSGPSDVPVREPGTRTRSGNTMPQTRAALLEATSGCIARYGVRKTTMVDVASRSGVAKATLYNHFRTKEDVLVALVEHRVSELVAQALAADTLEDALTAVATAIADSAPLTKVAADEPAALAPLLRGGESRGWQLAREGAKALLTQHRLPAGPVEVELVLRWAASQLLWPAGGPASSGSAELARALAGAVRPAAPAEPVALPPQQTVEAKTALGWPV